MLASVLSITLLVAAADDSRIHTIFLGDRGHHQPAARLHDVYGPLVRSGITIDWEEDLSAITPARLADIDCLVMYANQAEHPEVPPDFLESLLDYVRSGGGLVALHCTSGCFMESQAWLDLIGSRFVSHGAEVFTQQVIVDDHPITEDWTPFTSWDETYVQAHATTPRTVLAIRDDEPWMWVRSEGRGRVFYTASGHDERTWREPGFLEMLTRAIDWASGEEATARRAAFKLPQFTYEAQEFVPNYEGRDPRMRYQLPSTPEEARASLVAPAGFRVELFAAEPMVVNPIAMDWDERGRCWVIETPDYPNDVQEDLSGGDRISILEDSDGDGRADRKTVYAEGLNLPTSILKVRGGVLVTQAPDLLFLADADGDDVADDAKVLFRGFGRSDTHAGPSSLALGPDNAIWGAVGYSAYSGSDGSTFGSGLWRWSRGARDPQFLAQFTNNTWGLGLRSDGEIFGSTANGAPSFFVGALRPELALAAPDHAGAAAAFETAIIHPALGEIRQGDWMGQYTAAAGHAFATGAQVPASWNETAAFVCEPTGHLVGRLDAYPAGAGYKVRDCFNLCVSTDDWFCPVQAQIGPDGAIWIADFAQFIILHNLPGNPERGLPRIEYGPGNAHLNPLRDSTHGRIFRLVRDGQASPMDLSGADQEALVAALAHPNRFWRVTARRLLMERGMMEAMPAIHAMAIGDDDLAAAAALRTLGGLGDLNGSRGMATLSSVLTGEGRASQQAALAHLPATWAMADLLGASGLLAAPDPVLRRHALLAAARMPHSAAMGFALADRASLEDLDDPWLFLAMSAAAVAHANPFIAVSTASLQGLDDSQAQRVASLIEVASRSGREADVAALASGGEVHRGERIFYRHATVTCRGCHTIGKGRSTGPDLAGLGSRMTPLEILSSILEPHETIAEDFEDAAASMPQLRSFLSDDQLRDLVAFLASLR